MTVTKDVREPRAAVGRGRRVAGATMSAILIGALALTPPALAQGETPAAPVGQEVPTVAAPAEPSSPAATEAAAAPSAATRAQLPAASGQADATHDLSPMGMFLAADPVVKAVMVILVLASVVTWSILLVKMLSLALAKRRLLASLDVFRSAASLSEAGGRVQRGVGALLVAEAEEEHALSEGLPSEGIKERAAIALSRLEAIVGKRMASGTGILATIGSIGPFVGLFGTVWGIMGSFIGIADSKSTSLAVVAPGIAEALLATGIGLVAAIPAVVIYNALTRSIIGYRTLVSDAVALIMRHLSRDLDRRDARTLGKSNLRLAAE